MQIYVCFIVYTFSLRIIFDGGLKVSEDLAECTGLNDSDVGGWDIDVDTSMHRFTLLCWRYPSFVVFMMF